MPRPEDLRHFTPGQRDIPASVLNALVDLAAAYARDPGRFRPRQSTAFVKVQAAGGIASGATGSVKAAMYDPTAGWYTSGEAFDAFNVGPGTAPLAAVVPLLHGNRDTPYFQYFAASGDDASSSSSSSSTTSTSHSTSSSSSSSSSSDELGEEACPPGSMLAYGGATAPGGWLLCDGSAVNRTTYSLLFAAIGTAYGVGDGSTTFNLPDCRRRRILGKAAADALGGSEGEAVGNRLLVPAAPTIQCVGGGGPPTTDSQQDSIMDHGGTEVQSGTGVTVAGNGTHTITPHAHSVTDIEASDPVAADHPYLIANWIIKY